MSVQGVDNCGLYHAERVLSLFMRDIQLFLLHCPNFSFQNIMFYDMGAGSTVCTIVTYQTVKTKDSGTQPQLQIQGIG